MAELRQRLMILYQYTSDLASRVGAWSIYVTGGSGGDADISPRARVGGMVALPARRRPAGGGLDEVPGPLDRPPRAQGLLREAGAVARQV